MRHEHSQTRIPQAAVCPGEAPNAYEYPTDYPHHRHMSHLYGAHPGDELAPNNTPELMTACRRSLELRAKGALRVDLDWEPDGCAAVLLSQVEQMVSVSVFGSERWKVPLQAGVPCCLRRHQPVQ